MMEVHVCNRRGALLRAFALGDSDEVIIGREASCDIRIKSPAVSREHCAIEREGDGLILRDLGSTAGVIVGGQKQDRVPLSDGVEITIGPVILKFYEGGL